MASRSNRKNTARPVAPQAKGVLSPSKPDPIFALIEKHKAAEAAFCRAIDAENAAEKKAGISLRSPPSLNAGAVSIKCPADLNNLRDNAWEGVRMMFGADKKGGRRLRARALLGKVIKANVAAVRREHQRLEAAFFRTRDRSGWSAAAKQWDANHNASVDALENLCTTIPRTPAGFAALTEYLSSKSVVEQLEGGRNWVGLLLELVAKVASRDAAQLARGQS